MTSTLVNPLLDLLGDRRASSSSRTRRSRSLRSYDLVAVPWETRRTSPLPPALPQPRGPVG